MVDGPRCLCKFHAITESHTHTGPNSDHREGKNDSGHIKVNMRLDLFALDGSTTRTALGCSQGSKEVRDGEDAEDVYFQHFPTKDFSFEWIPGATSQNHSRTGLIGTGLWKCEVDRPTAFWCCSISSLLPWKTCQATALVSQPYGYEIRTPNRG